MQCLLYTDVRKKPFGKLRAWMELNATDCDAIGSDTQVTRYVGKFMFRAGPLGQFQQVNIEPGQKTNKRLARTNWQGSRWWRRGV